MKIAEVKVNGTTCDVTRLVPISKGLVGATVSIEYTDSAWDGLTKTIVFRSSVTKDVVATGSEVVIPAETVSRAGVNLYMGVYGVDAANNVVIPTIWAELGLVHGAATPSGDASTDSSLPVWAQIQGMIGNLDDLDTEAKSSLVAAVNEALTKGGGEASGEPDYEYVTTIEIAEDKVVSYELDLGAEYKEVLITSVTNITNSNNNFTEYPGSSQQLLTSSGRIELKFFNGETALLSNRESIAHSIVIVLTVDASANRSYAFTIRDWGIFLQASVMQQGYSGGLNTTTQYSAIARKSLISNNARMNKIVLGTSSANIYFTKGARLYVYGVKA